MTHFDPDNFDIMLAAALKSRPDPVPGFDLAAAALTRARALQASDARLIPLARITFWKRLASIAAALLIAAILLIGYTRIPDATSTDTTAASTTTIDLTTLGLAAFTITLIAVVLATLLTSDRPQLRLASV